MSVEIIFKSRLLVKLEKLDNIENACQHWNTLQQYRNSIFLSLAWIKPWLLTLDKQVPFYAIYFSDKDNVIVGMAFLTRSRIQRRKFFSIDLLSLNESEKKSTKFIIEYNNILHNTEYRNDIYFSFIDFLANSAIKFDEVKLNTTDTENIPDIKIICDNFNLHFTEEENSKAYYTDLTRFQSKPDQYLSSLSKNKREQIKRSLKYLEQFGDGLVKFAETKNEAINYFENMEILHQNYWTKKGQNGSFSNKNWKYFHKAIIYNFSENTQLARISFGEHIVGYLYNLIDGDIAYSMQSGFNYSVNKNDRPGLISHFLLTNYYIANSFKKYEYLAGEAQYKQSLSTNYNLLSWYTIQKKTLKMNTENYLLRFIRLLK